MIFLNLCIFMAVLVFSTNDHALLVDSHSHNANGAYVKLKQAKRNIIYANETW